MLRLVIPRPLVSLFAVVVLTSIGLLIWGAVIHRPRSDVQSEVPALQETGLPPRRSTYSKALVSGALATTAASSLYGLFLKRKRAMTKKRHPLSLVKKALLGAAFVTGATAIAHAVAAAGAAIYGRQFMPMRKATSSQSQSTNGTRGLKSCMNRRHSQGARPRRFPVEATMDSPMPRSNSAVSFSKFTEVLVDGEHSIRIPLRGSPAPVVQDATTMPPPLDLAARQATFQLGDGEFELSPPSPETSNRVHRPLGALSEYDRHLSDTLESSDPGCSGDDSDVGWNIDDLSDNPTRLGGAGEERLGGESEEPDTDNGYETAPDNSDGGYHEERRSSALQVAAAPVAKLTIETEHDQHPRSVVQDMVQAVDSAVSVSSLSVLADSSSLDSVRDDGHNAGFVNPAVFGPDLVDRELPQETGDHHAPQIAHLETVREGIACGGPVIPTAAGPGLDTAGHGHHQGNGVHHASLATHLVTSPDDMGEDHNGVLDDPPLAAIELDNADLDHHHDLHAAQDAHLGTFTDDHVDACSADLDEPERVVPSQAVPKTENSDPKENGDHHASQADHVEAAHEGVEDDARNENLDDPPLASLELDNADRCDHHVTHDACNSDLDEPEPDVPSQAVLEPENADPEEDCVRHASKADHIGTVHEGVASTAPASDVILVPTDVTRDHEQDLRNTTMEDRIGEKVITPQRELPQSRLPDVNSSATKTSTEVVKGELNSIGRISKHLVLNADIWSPPPGGASFRYAVQPFNAGRRGPHVLSRLLATYIITLPLVAALAFHYYLFSANVPSYLASFPDVQPVQSIATFVGSVSRSLCPLLNSHRFGPVDSLLCDSPPEGPRLEGDTSKNALQAGEQRPPAIHGTVTDSTSHENDLLCAVGASDALSRDPGHHDATDKQLVVMGLRVSRQYGRYGALAAAVFSLLIWLLSRANGTPV
ncbi:Uncharacterized protein PBTT_04167 [Plasmodiophora brassicae]